MSARLVVALAAVLQLAAAGRAVLLIRVAGRRVAWLYVAGALLLMEARRLLALRLAPPTTAARFEDYLALGVSGLMLAGIWGIGELFTDLSTSRSRLAAGDRRYRALVQQSSEGIFVLDPATRRIQEANSRFLEITGYSDEEVTSLNLGGLVAASPRAVQEDIDRVIADGQTLIGERRYRRKDGTTLEVDVMASLVRYDDGDVVLVNVRDLGEAKRNERIAELLHDVDERILALEPLQSILPSLCEKTAEIFDAPLVWLGLPREDGSLGIAAASGRLSESAATIHDHGEADPCPAERVLRTGASEHHQGFSEAASGWARRAAAAGLTELAVLPISGERKPLGVLVVFAAGATPLVTGGLQRLADRIALSLQQGRHLEQIRLRTAALEAAANAVIITDRKGRIEWVNRAFSGLTGYNLNQVAGKTPRILKSGKHDDFVYERLWKTIVSGRVWRGELFNRRKNGTIFAGDETITPVRGGDGAIQHFIGIMQDVTVRRQAEERIHYLALHDPLTDLPNRRALEDRLTRAVARARRGARHAVLMLDLDNFKIVNDSLGHPAGDQVLLDLVAVLRRAVRPSDELARLGGDEFAVLIEGTSLAEAQALADRLRRSVEEHGFRVGDRVFALSASVGVVCVDGGLDTSAILALADTALYSAKERGRNRVVTFRPEDAAALPLSLESTWATRLKEALRTDSFQLLFQPIRFLATEKAVHHEVLVRLRDENGELIAPGAFLPAAERFGLASRLDRWVIARALEALEKQPELSLFVNLSGATLSHPEFLSEIEGTVRSANLVPGRLVFEITETAAVGDMKAARTWMRRLRELGCGFALDDFGTGFSSFAYLEALPADFVKIDGSFIQGLDRDPVRRAIVRAIQSVARSLGKATIAEWVEQPEVVDILIELGVEYGQGHTLGAPSASPAASAAPAVLEGSIEELAACGPVIPR